MKVWLKVAKADGSIEEYSHTKVIGTICNALAHYEQADIHIAEQLAEVVTYFLYHKRTSRPVHSSEIHSIIKVVLTATKHEDAAVALSEHYFNRKLKRSRLEVISIDVEKLEDTDKLDDIHHSSPRSRWNKSQIVDDLVKNYKVTRQTARTIASMVEEKIFNLGLNYVPAKLIKQLVLGDAAAILRAQRQLQTV